MSNSAWPKPEENAVSDFRRIRLYIQQNFPGDDFRVSKFKIMKAFSDKIPHFIVRRIGAFAVLEDHHSNADAFSPIQYIIRFESMRSPQDLTDAAFGAAGGIRNRTNLGELPNEYVHQALHSFQFQHHASKHIEPLLN
jgi:hypothetical protein